MMWPSTEICVSRDGKLVASAGADKTVRLWNGSNGQSVRTIPVGSLAYAVALSPDGTRVVAGSFDGLVRVFVTATGKPVVTLASTATEWLARHARGLCQQQRGLGDDQPLAGRRSGLAGGDALLDNPAATGGGGEVSGRS